MASKKVEGQYEVHTALREDMNEGWVWIENRQLETELNHRRRIVRISSQSHRNVYCEALYLDDYYVRRFNEERTDEPLPRNATGKIRKVDLRKRFPTAPVEAVALR